MREPPPFRLAGSDPPREREKERKGTNALSRNGLAKNSCRRVRATLTMTQILNNDDDHEGDEDDDGDDDEIGHGPTSCTRADKATHAQGRRPHIA